MKHRHDDYSDIIALPHYELQFHTRMPMEARAAQFAPFSALTGYEEAIGETSQRVARDVAAGDGSEDQDAAWDDWDAACDRAD